MDKHWAQAREPREQQVLFNVTLDDIIPAGHPIRALEVFLSTYDWSPWEKEYDGYRGQPPIHPRLMAGCILYGLMRNLRSSRQLEDATRERRDFRWFLEGREIDHCTFARFRTRHGEKLKHLHRHIARAICERYEDALLELVLDGTRIRANSDRHGARKAETLERFITEVAQVLNQKLARLAEVDASGERDNEELARLRKEVDRLQSQVEKYEKALEQARVRDAHKRKRDGKKAKPVRVPVTDPESHIQPNKEGGYAPNYTPVAAVDAASGAVIHAEVPPGAEESSCALPAVEEAKALGGVSPKHLLADGKVLCGETMQALESLGVEVYAPTGSDFSASNPANRPDPTQPVPEALHAQLPCNKNILSHAAFLYDPQCDCYYCPMGKRLRRISAGKHHTTGVRNTQYKCPGKAGCPLAGRCVHEKAAARTLTRDCYQETRDTIGRRMDTEAGRAIYKRRAPSVEGAFARIKHSMGIRAFLLRGLKKVRIEWNWVCAAYNLKILLQLGAKKRKQAQRPSQTPQNRLLSFQQAPWRGIPHAARIFDRMVWRAA